MSETVSGRAMGTEVSVTVVDGPPGAAATALERIVDLEHLWSRFRPESELSQLNRSDGRPMLVSPETAVLVEHLLWAHGASGGLFDPTVGEALVAAGYDRDFHLLNGDSFVSGDAVPEPRPAPGCGRVLVGREADLVELPAEVTLDPGGLGKGLAADIVATELLDSGARSALVDIGGDMRVAGDPSEGIVWSIVTELPVAQPDRGAGAPPLTLLDGGVATSSTLVRRWESSRGGAHHVIDPRTGCFADGATTVRVVAGAAWWAEAVATALIVDPAAAEAVPGLLATVDHEVWGADDG